MRVDSLTGSSALKTAHLLQVPFVFLAYLDIGMRP